VTAYDTTLGWRFVNHKMRELYGTEAMGETAENLAEEYGISRAEQDEFALSSHRKAVAAIEGGRFADEFVPVEVPGRKGPTVVDTGRGPTPGHDARGAREATTGLPRGRHGDGGELEQPERRSLGPRAHVEGVRRGARPPTARDGEGLRHGRGAAAGHGNRAGAVDE
jgi:hypothetical protein